jgi:hypothetical protein
MKRILAMIWKRGVTVLTVLTWLTGMTAFGQTHVGVPAVDVTQRPLVKTRVTLTPEVRSASVNGNLVRMDEVAGLTDTNGLCVFSNVVSAYYKVTIAGNPGSTYRIGVPTNSGYFTATALRTNVSDMQVTQPVWVTGVTSSDGSVVITPENGQGAVDLSVVGGGGGITLSQATAAAESVVQTNTTAVTASLRGEISTASNTVFTAIETPGRTNTVVDGSVGLELAQRIQDKLRANTNIFKILNFGDSIGGWDIGGPGTGIHKWLGRMYGHAGSAGRSVNIFGVGLELYAQSVGANPALVNQDAGTNWWSLWHKGTNGTIVRWSNANLPNGNTANNVGLYWVATPEGGEFAFQISTNGGAFSTVATCSGYAASREGRYTNFVLAVGDYRCQAATATDVTNTFLGAQIFNSSSNGIVGFYVFKGGANLSQMTNTPAAVWDGVITNYVPDLVIWNAAEVPDIGETLFEYHLTNSWLPWAQRNTNTVVWLTGAAFRGDSNDVMHARENEILRRTALTYGCIFTDTRYDAQSWDRSFSLGYMRGAISPGDIVHFTQTGASALGYAAVRKAGLVSSARPPGAVVATLPAYALTNLQPSMQIGASPGSGSLGIGFSNTLPGLLVDMSGTQKLRIGTPGAGYAAIYFGTNVGVADYAGYALLGDNRMTRLNARAGGEVGMAIGNTAVIYSTNATEVRVAGTLRATALEGSGLGITNIPMAGVTGLNTAIEEMQQEIADTTLNITAEEIGNVTNWSKVAPLDWREAKATKTLVVDAENGSDTTGLRGREDRSFATLAVASAASAPGDVILIRPGSNYVASSVWLKTNVTVRGFGQASRIYGAADQTNQAVLAVTNSGVTIEDLWVSGAGTAIGYIGGPGNLAYATNVMLRNVHADGGTYGVAWAGDSIGDGNGHSLALVMESCVVKAITYGIGVRVLGHTNAATVRMVNCHTTGAWDAVILGGCVAVIEGGRYIATEIDGVTTGNFADVTVRNAYVRGGPSANFDLFNDGYPTSILREDGVDYRTPEVGGDGWDRVTHVSRQGVQAGEVRTGSLVVSNGIAASSLTGTIDPARLPGWATLTNAMDDVVVVMGAETVITNLTGDITFTGPVWRSTTNFDSILIDMLPSGANRTVAVPTSWRTLDGAGSWVLTNGNSGELTVGGIPGRVTNAVFNQYWRP